MIQNCLTPPASPAPSDQIDLTLDHQPKVTGSTGPKGANKSDTDEQAVIDLTDKADKRLLMKLHEKLPKEPCKNTINFSGTIKTDTHTIEGQYYNTTNPAVSSVPETVGNPSFDELQSMLNEQAQLLGNNRRGHMVYNIHKNKLFQILYLNLSPTTLHPMIPPFHHLT